MFNPTTNSCKYKVNSRFKVKIPVDDKCQSYKIKLNRSDLPCRFGQHFYQEGIKCIKEETSTCDTTTTTTKTSTTEPNSRYISRFYFSNCFQGYFLKTNTYFESQNWRHVIKTSFKMGGYVKKMGRMSTIAYVRLDSPEKIVNVIITFSSKEIKIIKNKILSNKIKTRCEQSLHLNNMSKWWNMHCG